MTPGSTTTGDTVGSQPVGNMLNNDPFFEACLESSQYYTLNFAAYGDGLVQGGGLTWTVDGTGKMDGGDFAY